MKIIKLPWATMPDVISLSGNTYVCGSRDNEFFVIKINEADGSFQTVFRDPTTNGIGWGRFCVHEGNVHVAYKHQPSQLIKLAQLTPFAQYLSPPSLGLWGNNPLCWDRYTSGLLSCQVAVDNNVDNVQMWQGLAIDTESMGIVGTGTTVTNGQGYAYTSFGEPILKKDIRGAVPGMYDPVYTADGAICGAGLNGGVRIIDGDKAGTLFAGQYTGDPRITRQWSGKLAVVYWTPKEIENQMTVVVDLDINEIADAPIPVNVQPFSPNIAIGSYFCTSKQYGDFVVPGNYEMLLNGEDYNRMKIKRHVVAGVEALNVPPEMVMGYLVNKPEDFAAVRSMKNSRAFVYTDSASIGGLYPYLSQMRADDIYMPQAYLGQNESLFDFEARITKHINEVRNRFGFQMIITAGISDRGWHTDRTLQELMVVHDRLARLPNVVGLCFFSFGRPTGVVSHMSLMPWLQAFHAASPSLPAGLQTPPIPTQQPPKVNIVSYGSELTPYNEWRAIINDGNNPGTSVVVEFIQGSLHVRLTNPAGTDRSGLKRYVNIHD